MAYLVTGGAGFIGSHLVEALLRENKQVLCLDNFNNFYNPQIKRRNISEAKGNPLFKLIEGDILDFNLLRRIFQENEIEGVIHLAARAGVRPSIKQPLVYQEVNIRGTLNLLEVTKEFKVPKFIFASSSSVYGGNRKMPFSESDKVDNPISPYGASKKACELICYTYHHLYQISVFCLRFFTVYGPRQRPDMAIHKFTRLIHRGEKIPVYGDGTAKRDFTYISDIINGVVRAIEKCQGYEVYNLGESKTVEVREVIRLIETNLAKRAQIEYLPPQPGDVPITYADISKARRELGYSPRIDIEEGISKFVDWYKREGTLW